jgi:hypothetical protein
VRFLSLPCLLSIGIDPYRHSEDLQTLAASLPPPPSALSEGTATTDSEEEEEEDLDAPPDFTSRIPLVSSVSPSSSGRPSSGRRHASRRSHALSSSSSAGASSAGRRGPPGGIIGSTGLSAKERALWRWVNVEDLDGFLQQVYLYYAGKGIWAIGLERVLNLLCVPLSVRTPMNGFDDCSPPQNRRLGYRFLDFPPRLHRLPETLALASPQRGRHPSLCKSVRPPTSSSPSLVGAY